MSFLRVAGLLTPNGFIARAGREEDEPWRIETNSSDVRLELRDRRGLALRSADTRLERVVAPGPAGPMSMVRGSVELVPDARRLAVLDHGDVVHEVAVARRPPSVAITDAAVVADALRVQWTVAGRAATTASVLLQLDSGRTIPLARNVSGHAIEADLSQAPPSDAARAIVRVSDGVRSSTARSEPMAVAGTPARCVILRPGPDETAVEYQFISALGSAREADGHHLPADELSWWIDGRQVERGPLVAIEPLHAGTHRLELRHPDAQTASMRIDVIRASPAFRAMLDRAMPAGLEEDPEVRTPSDERG